MEMFLQRAGSQEWESLGFVIEHSFSQPCIDTQLLNRLRLHDEAIEVIGQIETAFSIITTRRRLLSRKRFRHWSRQYRRRK